MATLQIDLFDQSNHRRLWVPLRDNLPVHDLIHKLIIDLELPAGEYSLIDEQTNQVLPIDSTLKKEGIADEQTLRLQRKKKIPAVVPVPLSKPSKASANAGKATSAKVGGELPEDIIPESEPGYGWGAEDKRSEGDRERLPKPPPVSRPQRQPSETFWNRPLRRPGCLGWVSIAVWRYTSPIALLTLSLTMICCFTFGLLVCFSGRQGFFINLFPRAAAPPPTITPIITPTPTATPVPMADCEDVVYTYENASVLADFQAGKQRSDPYPPSDTSDLREMVKHFSDMQGIVVFDLSREDQPDQKTKMVLVAVNGAEHPETGNLFACVSNPVDGKNHLAQIDLRSNTIKIVEKSETGEIIWSQTKINTIEAYAPPEPRCWQYTYFAGFNIKKSPLENVELRRALVLAFDTEMYNRESYDSIENIAIGFLPNAIVVREGLLPENRIGVVYDPEEARRLLERVKTSGWLTDYPNLDNFLYPTYCNACPGSNILARDAINIWRRTLGIGGTAKGEPEEEHYMPIAGTDRQMYFVTLGSSNTFDFIDIAVSEGWIMLPDDGKAEVLDLLNQYAYEESPARRRAIINEIERLIIVEYAAILPFNFFEGCE